MSKEEITSLSDRTKKGETGSKVEGGYKKKEANATSPVHHDGDPLLA